MISRDWQCLNSRCNTVFHSWDHGNPPCPKCGCVRVDWVPGGGHIMAMAPRVDRNLRAIAAQHGMTDLNSPSPSRLNRAAPKAATRPAMDGYTHHFAGLGFASPIPTPSTRDTRTFCSTVGTDVRGKVMIGQPNSSKWLPGPEANAVVVGRDRRRTV